MRKWVVGAAVIFSFGLAEFSQAFEIPTSPRARAAFTKVEPTLARDLRATGLRLGAPIFMRVFKKSAELEVWVEDKSGRYSLFRTYDICNYSGSLGPKVKLGDKQSPEGFYYVTAEQLNPRSHYHLSFNLGYPNAFDQGLRRTGGNLMIHGDCVSIGCYAMTDEKIEEIYALAESSLRNGQRDVPVHVFPFRMTERAMYRFRRSTWSDFWHNLKQGYDLFEQDRRPPLVAVTNDRYVFSSANDVQIMIAARTVKDANESDKAQRRTFDSDTEARIAARIAANANRSVEAQDDTPKIEPVTASMGFQVPGEWRIRAEPAGEDLTSAARRNTGKEPAERPPISETVKDSGLVADQNVNYADTVSD